MLTLRSDGASLADARDLVGAFLAEHCPGVDAAAVKTVISELITNAIRHTSGSWSLTAALADGVFSVDVHDSSSSPPVPRPGVPDGTGGWGMHIISRLARQMEVTLTAQGKIVTVQWPATGDIR
ncbi:ATP-binding protein [Streptomyces sp. NA02950]|uniref:ATP-binding protein n=1 Tax=Streptomyces sp. NA02950 TaxID=2742137 RepID=UPI0015924035|nr:ATP-binding protein [Streptomyces sp. NA02950]QKV91455.1 ATP-binding protein [Streptomyces sp. NA02950]